MKKIKWLVQDVGKQSMLIDNFSTLKSINANFQSFGLIQGKNIVSNLEEILSDLDEYYIIRGGTKIVSLLDSSSHLSSLSLELSPFQLQFADLFFQKLRNSIFYDSQKFDQAFYSSLDLPLLNKDAFFLPISSNLLTFFDIPYFIKPSKDLKNFIPGILQPGQTVQNFVENSQYSLDYIHENLLVSPVKNISQEFRFFIIDKTVITGSQYKYLDKVVYSSVIPHHVWQIAKEYALLYQPHSIFTMDLAITDSGVYIVEYNCWNGSGLYHCDKPLLFSEVQNFIHYHS